MSASSHHPERGLADRLTALFWQRPRVLLALLLIPPLFWLGVVYVGSLAALLWQSFYSIDQFSGVVVKDFTLNTYRELLLPQNYDIIVRTVTMAALVTVASVVLAFPIAFFAARYAKGRWKAFFYLGIMLPLWSSYLVKVYAWKLILAKEGIVTWAANGIGAGSVLDGLLAIPVIGGNSLSTSYIGTFLVFVYVWLPYMILPMQAALERVPDSMLEASADLGAGGLRTLWSVILPLSRNGIVTAQKDTVDNEDCMVLMGPGSYWDARDNNADIVTIRLDASPQVAVDLKNCVSTKYTGLNLNHANYTKSGNVTLNPFTLGAADSYNSNFEGTNGTGGGFALNPANGNIIQVVGLDTSSAAALRADLARRFKPRAGSLCAGKGIYA